MTESDYRALRGRAASALFKLESVDGVGLGAHRVNGALTGEVAIVISLVPAEQGQPPPDDDIPTSFEGVPIDKIDLKIDIPTGPVPGASSPEGNQPELGPAAEPLVGGVSIAAEGKPGLGTLGCFLRDRDDATAIYALTNHHVVSVSGKLSRARRIVSPPPQHFGEPSDDDWLASNWIGLVAAGGDEAIRDAAIARLKPGTSWLPNVKDMPSPLAGAYDVTLEDMLTQQYQVMKRGARTRLSGGVVVCIDFEIRALYVDGKPVDRKGNLLIRPNANPDASPGERLAFGAEGDSGSAVVNAANQVVALLHGTDDASTSLTQGAGYATPIGAILRRFNEVDHLDLEVAQPAAGASAPEVVPPPGGKPHMSGPDQIARGDHGYYRPLPGGAPILVAPMLGSANASTLGCVVTDPNQPGPAYILTAWSALSAGGTLTPNAQTQIGQPDNTGHCSHCTSNTVGTFFKGGDADQTPQAGLVALGAGQPWLSEVIHVGLLSGSRSLGPGEGAGVAVVKSGGGSGLTGGTITKIEVVDGQQRMIIKPNPNAAKADQVLYFSQFADRGAVVVDAANFVVGVLYDELTVDGEHDIHGVAAPIAWVLDQLKTHAGVAVDVPSATAIDDVQTAAVARTADNATHPALSAAAPRPLLTDGMIERLGLPPPWRAHRVEIQRLIAGNRRVAALWRRHGGPALVQAIVRAFHVPVEAIPMLIDGVSLSECVERLGRILGRYASPALRAELSQLPRLVPRVAGVPLEEAVLGIRDAWTEIGLIGGVTP